MKFSKTTFIFGLFLLTILNTSFAQTKNLNSENKSEKPSKQQKEVREIQKTNNTNNEIRNQKQNSNVKQIIEVREQVKEQRIGGIENSQQIKDQNTQNREQKLQESQKDRCDKVLSLIDKRIEIFENTKTNHQQNYDKLTDRLNQVSSNLKQLSLDTISSETVLDTTNLDLSIEELSNMVLDYKNKYEMFLNTLKQTNQTDCALNNTDYKNVLEQSKEMLKELKSDRQEIKDFYVNTVRKNLIEIKEQAEQIAQDSDQGSTEDTNKDF